VEFGIGIGGMSVPGPARTKHHVASGHGALVHFPEVDRTKVDLEGSLVTEGLEADGALHATFT